MEINKNNVFKILKGKRELSSTSLVKIEIESLISGRDFSETLTRARFEELNKDLFKNILNTTQIYQCDYQNAQLSHHNITYACATILPQTSIFPL